MQYPENGNSLSPESTLDTTKSARQRQPKVQKVLSEAQAKRLEILRLAKDELLEKHAFSGSRKGCTQSAWSSLPTKAHPRTSYRSSFPRDCAGRVEIYMDAFSQVYDPEDRIKQLFDRIYAMREELEREFGEELSWERLDEDGGKRACRIAVYHPEARAESLEDLEEIEHGLQEWFVDRTLRLRKVFSPVLRKFNTKKSTRKDSK